LRGSPLGEAPGDHAADALKQNEERVNAAPGPRRVDSRCVIINIIRPKRSYEAVVNCDISDPPAGTEPNRGRGPEKPASQKMKVQFDITAREMDQDGGGADQPEAYGGSP
jgi:hypothetical protein